MSDAMAVIMGLIVGVFVTSALFLLLRSKEKETARALLAELDRQKAQEIESLVEQLKTHFAALSREALSANSEDFLKLARTQAEQQTALGRETLEGKKKLIDARLEEMGKKLGEVGNLMQTLEKDRRETHGVIKSGLERSTQATTKLYETTSQLREALASPQRRGQWGERMAEDVLRLAGFIEGVNYRKQEQGEGGGRPDFTFLLPGQRRVNMDVKFPLDNYLKVLDARDDASRDASEAQFLRDVRSRIKEVTKREYIDPAGGTVDYVLIFIPNEQIYGFIHEMDPTLLDDALKQKVVLCSPLTLYAVLAVMRQAAEHFRLQEASAQILKLLGDFTKQWGMFVKQMDKMGDRLEDAGKAYEELKGVRTRQLERQLDKVEDLRSAGEGLLLDSDEEGAA